MSVATMSRKTKRAYLRLCFLKLRKNVPEKTERKFYNIFYAYCNCSVVCIFFFFFDASIFSRFGVVRLIFFFSLFKILPKIFNEKSVNVPSRSFDSIFQVFLCFIAISHSTSEKSLESATVHCRQALPQTLNIHFSEFWSILFQFLIYLISNENLA